MTRVNRANDLRRRVSSAYATYRLAFRHLSPRPTAHRQPWTLPCFALQMSALSSFPAVASKGTMRSKNTIFFRFWAPRQGRQESKRGASLCLTRKKVKKISSLIFLYISRKAKMVKKYFHFERYFFDFLRLLYSKGGPILPSWPTAPKTSQKVSLHA